MPTLPPLSARETYQLLKDVALGVRSMSADGEPRWHELQSGAITVWVDDWRVTISSEGGEVGHCLACTAPDGRVADEQTWSRYGTNPVELLSRWEREQLERRLREC